MSGWIAFRSSRSSFRHPSTTSFVVCFIAPRRVVDRTARARALDDRLAEGDIARPIHAGSERRRPADNGIMEGQQLALERALVGRDLLGHPGAGAARLTVLNLEERRFA